MLPKPKYITNKELLVEIHRSKTTYCYFVDDSYAAFDAIVESVADITVEFAETVLIKKNIRPRRAENFVLTPSIDCLVFRVMTHEHVPLCDDKKRRSRSVAGQGHLRTIFPPFKHYILENGEPKEVGRSHWRNGLHNGEFCQEHGRMTNRLAQMFMLLVERYSRKSNWRNYSYNDEMRSSALLQLSQNGLLFDESKSDNPFSFYTTTLKHSFTRVLNVEKKNQDMRDDMLVMAGAMPSYTRQIDNELSQKPAEVVTATTAPAKRGRKAKSTTTDKIDDGA